MDESKVTDKMYSDFLEKVGLSKANMQPEQWDMMQQAFMAGCSSTTVEINEGGGEALKTIQDECFVYWNQFSGKEPKK